MSFLFGGSALADATKRAEDAERELAAATETIAELTELVEYVQRSRKEGSWQETFVLLGTMRLTDFRCFFSTGRRRGKICRRKKGPHRKA